jgi:hypothetical protein
VGRRIGRIQTNPVMRRVSRSEQNIVDSATRDDRLESLSYAADNVRTT